MIENPILSDELRTGDPVDLIGTVIVSLVNVFFIVGAVSFFFMFIIGGIQWITSGGDKANLANAQARIKHAIIGLIILLSSYALITFIERVFHVNILLIDVNDLLTL